MRFDGTTVLNVPMQLMPMLFLFQLKVWAPSTSQPRPVYAKPSPPTRKLYPMSSQPFHSMCIVCAVLTRSEHSAWLLHGSDAVWLIITYGAGRICSGFGLDEGGWAPHSVRKTNLTSSVRISTDENTFYLRVYSTSRRREHFAPHLSKYTILHYVHEKFAFVVVFRA